MAATPRSRGGFTLVELLVSMALMVILMISISEVFKVSSDSASRVAADVEILAASAAFRERVSDQINKMTDGLLVIDCPAPTPPRREIRGGDHFLRLRQDRLVFMTHGDVGEYQSFTDPTRGNPATVDIQPAIRTANSAEALIYFGPGIPLTKRSIPAAALGGLNDPTLTASEWVFLHRSILLMLESDADPAIWSPPDMDVLAGGMLNRGPLEPGFLNGTMDAVVSSAALRANVCTVADIILGMNLDNTDLLSANPSIAALWQPSLAPRSVSLNTGSPDFFTRSGSSFIRHMADFRIEWTDGRRIDPLGGDLRTRWFGLRPDPHFDVNNGVLDSIATTQIPNIAVRRQDFPGDTQSDEAAIFGMISGTSNKIEWDNGVGPATDRAYRAIWRGDTWQFRPKALRFTYRIYDRGNRLKQATEVDLDEDGLPDPDGAGPPRLFTRFGRRFSVVVMLP